MTDEPDNSQPPLQGTHVMVVGATQPYLVVDPPFEILQELLVDDTSGHIAVSYMWRSHIDLPWEPHRGTLALNAVLTTVKVDP